MKHFKKTSVKLLAIVIVVLIVFGRCGHLPGHGNREESNLKEVVENCVSSTLKDGETVEFGGRYDCEDYKENDEVRFSAKVTYDVVSKDGTKVRHTAFVVCNEDKDKIIEWKELK